MRASAEARQLRTLNRLIDHIGPGMLTCEDDAGQLISRPMTPLKLDADGNLWFFIRSRADAAPRAALASYRVNIAFAQPEDASYVSVTGNAQVVHDAARTEVLWSPVIRLWFADGMKDPELALLRVAIVRAEYWDAKAGAMAPLWPAA
ncbi:MAG: hypothetical protein EOO54_11765 [Haliea sp.]|nr:MAG: hypothetical protein EOO54_11765 [Haliea sp.]